MHILEQKVIDGLSSAKDNGLYLEMYIQGTIGYRIIVWWKAAEDKYGVSILPSRDPSAATQAAISDIYEKIDTRQLYA